MEIEKVIVIAVIATILIVIVRQNRQEQGVILSLLTTILLVIWIINDMVPIIAEIKNITEYFSFSGENVEILLKTLGICLLSQSGSDVCRDAGETSLAAKIQLASKTAILILCLPLFRQFLEMISKLIL